MPRKREVDPLLAYRQHGFRERRKSPDGTHAIGDCPWCGKTEHFYVNTESKKWDCKRCGREGGFQIFLQEIIRISRECSELDQRLAELATDRGLNFDTLQQYNVGYNPLTNEYIIPVYYHEAGETKVWNLRRAIRKQDEKGETKFDIYGTADCQTGILGWEQAPAFPRLWLCEGGWDAMACNELLQRLGIETDFAVGLPGAKGLKTQWIPLFQKHDVIAVYDADDAGRQGALRAYNLLRNRIGVLQFVHWGEVKEGYDLRDAYRERGTAAFDYLLGQLKPTPEGVVVAEDSVGESRRFRGPGLTAEEVYRIFNKWLYMEDTTLIDVVFGTMIGNRDQGDPIWLHIVAPPGATKTEMLRSLDGAPGTTYRNTITAKNLVSGQINAGGGDASLLPRLHEQQLIIEDFTTILSTPIVFRQETYGILRAAYNGKYEREWGNARYVNFLCHFGIITGVTPAIEQHAESMGAVGERFLNYAPYIPDDPEGRMPFIKKAQANRGHEEEMRKELADAARKCLTYPFDVKPEMSEGLEHRICELALWSAMMRGTVPREQYSAQKEVTHAAYWELGTRLVKQYTKLADGIARFKRLSAVRDQEFNIVRSVAIATIRTSRLKIVRTMYRKPKEGWSAMEVSEATNLPRSPLCERELETLSMLKVLRQERGVKGLRGSYHYHLTEPFLKLTRGSTVFQSKRRRP